MKGFSIRRHKRNASDPAASVTEDPPMSTSQRSVYGSVMSSRHRNRLHKPHHSLDEVNDPHADTAERPRRKLVKKTRQQHSDSSPEERISVTPPEQKPHGSGLPVTFDRPVGKPNREWAGDDYSSAGRSMAPYVSMRYSVGSSADVLLTPIRGSTAMADDFVLLPTSRTVETAKPDEIGSSSDPESPESPGPTIATLVTEPDIYHDAERELLGNEAGIPESSASTGGMAVANNGSHSELGSNTYPIVPPQPTSPETPTVSKPTFKYTPSTPITPQEPVLLPPAPSAPKPTPPPVVELIKCPVPRNPLPTPPPTVRAPSSSRSAAKAAEPRNVVPFPMARPLSVAVGNADAIYSPPGELYEHPLTVWLFAIWDTTVGIAILAMECYRWLIRKGMRDDFRSRMSVWFLREVTVGLFIPVFLAVIALLWLARTMYPGHGVSSTPT